MVFHPSLSHVKIVLLDYCIGLVPLAVEGYFHVHSTAEAAAMDWQPAKWSCDLHWPLLWPESTVEQGGNSSRLGRLCQYKLAQMLTRAFCFCDLT